MSDNGVWPPPMTHPEVELVLDKPTRPPISRRYFNLAIILGCILTFADVHSANDIPHDLLVALAALLCFLQGRFILFWAIVLCVILYVSHVIAIMLGGKPPYVESSVAEAAEEFFFFIPFLLSGLLGWGLRWIVDRLRSGVKARVQQY